MNVFIALKGTHFLFLFASYARFCEYSQISHVICILIFMCGCNFFVAISIGRLKLSKRLTSTKHLSFCQPTWMSATVRESWVEEKLFHGKMRQVWNIEPVSPWLKSNFYQIGLLGPGSVVRDFLTKDLI